MERLLLSPEEAGEVLNLGKSTIYDLIRLRMLTSVKIGKRRLIPSDACRELVERLVSQQEEEVSL
ncbi:excisionase family DNA-binding protein [Actinocatenispora sera]|jgi:excisionase family DNA binding protein|uniref:excisionase family DNA-binding protein n=1 Tax=Actinocatenispora sera TaxID=390989 RepID=UPI0033E48DFF